MGESRMKRSDIPEIEVLTACAAFHSGGSVGAISSLSPGEVLAKRYPEKVVAARMQQLVDMGLLEYGVSLRTAWLSDAGKKRLVDAGQG
jgi:hypothetical protein